MRYNLIVEDFGKIKQANIEVSPLTLIVGDNNSGKSYLLSLLWGLYSAGHDSFLFRNLEELRIEGYKEIYSEIKNMIEASRKEIELEVKFNLDGFIKVLNAVFEKRKDIFVQGIFNYEGISIGKMKVEILKEQIFTIKSNYDGKYLHFSYRSERRNIGFNEKLQDDFIVRMMIQDILSWIINPKKSQMGKNIIYLPAARTGFMLAKDIINKVGRRAAYDVMDEEEIEETQDMQPFTKPIMQFLDTLEDLSIDNEGLYVEIAEWMESVMAHGNIQYSQTNRKEIRYIPNGEKESLPLRATSAVVTELAPLAMLLKYKKRIDTICYEEPEMCLHPQLQQEMGRLLIRLVNGGIPVIATTHSDIIIQHINNMCRLAEMGCPHELLEKLRMSQEDAIDVNKVAVYQLTDKGNYSEVEKIIPRDGEFQVRTFSNALLNILNQTSEVQEFESEQEE